MGSTFCGLELCEQSRVVFRKLVMVVCCPWSEKYDCYIVAWDLGCISLTVSLRRIVIVLYTVERAYKCKEILNKRTLGWNSKIKLTIASCLCYCCLDSAGYVWTWMASFFSYWNRVWGSKSPGLLLNTDDRWVTDVCVVVVSQTRQSVLSTEKFKTMLKLS